MMPDPADLFAWGESRPAAAWGETFVPTLDGKRLGKQALGVYACLRGGDWRTLAEIGAEVDGSLTGISARIREIRAWLEETSRGTVERRRQPGAESRGIFQYRIVYAAP